MAVLAIWKQLWILLKRHNLVVIEDAVDALEAKYKGRKVRNIGHLSCFSFYVTKNVRTR